MTDTLDIDFVERKLLPVINKLAKDKTSNVRMNSAVVLKKLAQTSKVKEVLTEANGLLEELKKDTDHDVVNAVNDTF